MMLLRITREELHRRIAAEQPTWLRRAAEQTAANRAAGQHVGRTIWSDIKPILRELQLDKCPYCERRLPKKNVEWDVEHYRPKGRVTAWPPGTTAAPEPGYHWLAYEVSNYLACCKTCNTDCKGDYFPLAGKRCPPDTPVEALHQEEPLLIHPLAEGEDPDRFITFEGAVPQATGPEPDRRRAVVTIALLKLESREELIYERSQAIRDVWLAFTHPDTHLADRALDTLCANHAPHSRCARSFRRLCSQDPDRARELLELALAYLEGHSP